MIRCGIDSHWYLEAGHFLERLGQDKLCVENGHCRQVPDVCRMRVILDMLLDETPAARPDSAYVCGGGENE